MAKAKKKEALSLEEMIVLVDEQPYEVPENWCWIRLLDAFDNLTDSKKKLATKEYLEEGLYPIVDQGQAFIGGYTDAEGMLYEGELPVVVFGDHTRCMKYIDFSFVQGADGVKVLRPKKFWDSKAFYYAFKSIDIPNLGYRRHYPLFKDFCIPVPPLAEQQRIVEQIESLFAKLDEAKTKIEEAIDGHERRKAAILYKLFSGELTSKWREENNKRKEDWISDSLGEYVESQYGYTEKATYEKIGPQFLRITDIQDNHVCWAEVPYCKISDDDYERYALHKGDIVVARTGATTGKSYMVQDEVDSVFASFLIRLVVKSEKLTSEYLYCFMQSQNYWSQITDLSSGIAQPGVNSKKFKELQLPIPSIQEQKEMVRIVERLLQTENECYERLIKMIEQVDLMKKSILAKAFRGELGTNNPDEEGVVELLKSILATE